MSFLLLMMSIYAFGEVEKQSNQLSTEALFKDVAGRVAASVLEMTEIARARAEGTDIDTSEYFVTKSLPIPRDVRGFVYRITLVEKEVTVADLNGQFSGNASTLNFEFEPHLDLCNNPTYVVCFVGGSALSDAGRILIKYEYDESHDVEPDDTCTSAPVWNCITIT